MVEISVPKKNQCKFSDCKILELWVSKKWIESYFMVYDLHIVKRNESFILSIFVFIRLMKPGITKKRFQIETSSISLSANKIDAMWVSAYQRPSLKHQFEISTKKHIIIIQKIQMNRKKLQYKARQIDGFDQLNQSFVFVLF